MNDHAGKEAGKTVAVACPFTVVVDSREQLPWLFEGIRIGGKPVIVPVERGTLASGDYSIKGLETLVAVERKSVADFYGSITTWRHRLEAEFRRMETMQFSAIVVEDGSKACWNPAFMVGGSLRKRFGRRWQAGQ